MTNTAKQPAPPQPSPSPEHGPEHEPLPLPILLGMVALSASVLLAAVVWAGVRLWPEKTYPTDTPMAVVESAGQMLQDRRADRLVELIEPVPPTETDTARADRMQDLYIRLGRVLAAAQDLHRAVEIAMPDELDKLNEQIAAAQQRGEQTGLLATLMPTRSRTPETPQRRAARERAMSRILADPFASLDDAVTTNIDRVGIQEIGADTVAVTWDGRAVLPPFGLTMRRHDEGWRVVPPTSLPMIRRFLPESEAEFQIWGSLLATVESLLDDLRRAVQSGRINTLDALSRKAIEDAIIPMGMVMIALGNADED